MSGAGMYEKFANYCTEPGLDNAVLADLYLKTLDKDNIISTVFRSVFPPNAPAVTTPIKINGFNIYYITPSDGMDRIELRSARDIVLLVFIVSKVYNKSGERIYQYRTYNGRFKYGVRRDIITECLTLESLLALHVFIYEELGRFPRSTLMDNARRCDFATYLMDARYDNYDHIPRDFIVKYSDGQKEIRVHKFPVACLSEFLRILMYGSGAIKGVDIVDLSGFKDSSVEWVMGELIYNPTVVLGRLEDEDWMLLNYLHIDIDNIIGDVLTEIGL
jgi:uncharacterized membrane protein